MAVYRIAGIWKNADNVITHYAFHTVNGNTTDRANKQTKAQAIQLLETPGNTGYTWVWNYTTARWNIGEQVQVVEGMYGRYLRSNPDDQLTDNLSHLIDFDWIAP